MFTIIMTYSIPCPLVMPFGKLVTLSVNLITLSLKLVTLSVNLVTLSLNLITLSPKLVTLYVYERKDIEETL